MCLAHGNTTLLFACRGCGEGAALASSDYEYVVCTECCEGSVHPDGETGHQYEYCRWERDYPCRVCGALPPHDWYDRYNDYDLDY